MLTVMVTGAGGNIADSMIRSLREWEEEVHIVGTEANDYYGYLSKADVTYQVPLASDESYISRINRLVQKESVDVVLPSNGWEVLALSEAVSRLQASTALPSGDAVREFQNKWRLSQRLRTAEVPVPVTKLIETEEDIEEAVDTIKTDTVWVRGIGIKDVPGREMEGVRTISDWIDYHNAWGKCTVSAYLRGADLTWLGVFDQGTLVCSQGRQRVDYAESESWGGGAPTVSRTVHREDINQLGEQAIQSVEETPHGVYFTDMRENEHGQPMVTEVNPGRLGTTSSAFYLDAGLNLTVILVKIAIGREYESLSPYDVLPEGLYYISKASCEPVIVEEEEIETNGF